MIILAKVGHYKWFYLFVEFYTLRVTATINPDGGTIATANLVENAENQQELGFGQGVSSRNGIGQNFSRSEDQARKKSVLFVEPTSTS